MSNSFDVIVVGAGSMGSAACCHLARRGVRVLGLEQFDVPNVLASHHGFSRMIRLAYFEHPDYVALLRRAYENWESLERESGQKLLHITGGLYLGRPDSELVSGSIEAARKYDLPHEVIDPRKLKNRFPQFQVPDGTVAFYETRAGFLMPEKVVAAQAMLAMQHGAEIHGHEKVLSWQADGGGVTVRTDRDEYRAGRVLFTSGAWTDRLVADLGVPLKVTRQVMAWFWPPRPRKLDSFALGTFPSWAMDLEERSRFRGVHYGFPMMPDNPGFKIALHWPADVCDPNTVVRTPLPGDEANVRDAIRRYIPDADGPLLALRVCLYTNSPDGHFILDRHPNHDNVVLAFGFSGHGFKFVSVIGEALADMAMHGRTSLPIGFLGLSRFNRPSTS